MNYTLIMWKFLTVISIFQDVTAIIGGNIAKEGEFKYMASVRTPWGRCGGAIISENHILTAAHCVHCLRATDVKVTVGVANLRLDIAVIHDVRKINEHANFVPQVSDPSLFRQCFMWAYQCALGPVDLQMQGTNDIAILTLNTSLVFEGNVDKVDLPTNYDALSFCTPCKFSGWGWVTRAQESMNKILRWTELIALTTIECNALDTFFRDTEFCAINPETKSCLMMGDSGSPLVCSNTLVGVAFASIGDPRDPALFVRVSRHMDMITKVMNDGSSN